MSDLAAASSSRRRASQSARLSQCIFFPLPLLEFVPPRCPPLRGSPPRPSAPSLLAPIRLGLRRRQLARGLVAHLPPLRIERATAALAGRAMRGQEYPPALLGPFAGPVPPWRRVKRKTGRVLGPSSSFPRRVSPQKAWGLFRAFSMVLLFSSHSSLELPTESVSGATPPDQSSPHRFF